MLHSLPRGSNARPRENRNEEHMASSPRAAASTPTGAEARAETGTSADAKAGAEGSSALHAGSCSGQDQRRPPGPLATATIDAVTVSCLANALYHGAREAWLDTAHRWFMFFVIVLGA